MNNNTANANMKVPIVRLVNALLCKPTKVAPLSNQDQNDARVAVRSTLMVMAIKLMAAAVRANPNARNYGAWKVGANPDADPKAEPGSPEDIEGWDIHVACVRPGGKGPADLVAEKVDEIDRLRVDLAEAEATILNERGEGGPPEEGWVPFFEVDGEVEDATVCVTRWRVDMDGGLVCYAGVDAFQGGAWWAIHRKVDRRTVFLRSGDADTLRAAMRAATASAKGGGA